MPNEIERADLSRMGVAQKCTYCSDRIDFGLENAMTPGVDPRATPACVNSCIADALHFGDIDDANSNVSQLLREQRHFRMHEEVGTEPSFYYAYGQTGEMPRRRTIGIRFAQRVGLPHARRRTGASETLGLKVRNFYGSAPGLLHSRCLRVSGKDPSSLAGRDGDRAFSCFSCCSRSISRGLHLCAAAAGRSWMTGSLIAAGFFGRCARWFARRR
jgi:hypothetical protein